MSLVKPKLADPGTLIRTAKHRTVTFPVCVDPDLVSEYEDLVAARSEAGVTPRDSLAAGSDVQQLDAQIAELLLRIEAATVVLRFRELPRPTFRALTDKHPPRKDEDGTLTHTEDFLGVNFETFHPELVRACLIEPELDAETTDLLIDGLGDRQWEDLTTVVWNLHRKSVNVPFSPAASPTRRNFSRK